MEFRVISTSLTSFEELTAWFLANLRVSQQQRQQVISNVSAGTITIADRLFQAFPGKKRTPAISPPGSGRKPKHGAKPIEAALNHSLHIPHRTDPTTRLPSIGPNMLKVSNDIILQIISDRGRNSNDFYHFGTHYAYVLVVNRLSGQHSWTLAKDPAPIWIQIAKGEVGVAEIKGATNDHRIIDYQYSVNPSVNGEDGKDFAWCATFVNWVLAKAGFPASNRRADGKKIKGRMVGERGNLGTMALRSNNPFLAAWLLSSTTASDMWALL